MPAGRPSLYDEAYCGDVIEYGKAGKSLTWIATEIGVTVQTLLNWKDAHPEFLEALTRAKHWSQRWWEDKGQDGMEQQGFNASVWSRSMAARFPDDWREVKGTELTGKDGAPVETIQRIERVIVDPANPDAP
jgi:hypothetical protein